MLLRKHYAKLRNLFLCWSMLFFVPAFFAIFCARPLCTGRGTPRLHVWGEAAWSYHTFRWFEIWVVQIQFNNITGENDCKPQYFWVYLLIHLSPVRKPSVGVAHLPAAMSDSLEPWRSVKRCWRLWFVVRHVLHLYGPKWLTHVDPLNDRWFKTKNGNICGLIHTPFLTHPHKAPDSKQG